MKDQNELGPLLLSIRRFPVVLSKWEAKQRSNRAGEDDNSESSPSPSESSESSDDPGDTSGDGPGGEESSEKSGR